MVGSQAERQSGKFPGDWLVLKAYHMMAAEASGRHRRCISTLDWTRLD